MQSVNVDQTEIPKGADFGPKPGGFNLLNVDTELTGDDFWKAYNQPFLDEAVSRGDPIYLATVPKNPNDILNGGFQLACLERKWSISWAKDIKPESVFFWAMEWDKVLV